VSILKDDKNARFKIKESQILSGHEVQIVVDTVTGVNYVHAIGTGFTPLLDENGNLVIDKKEKE